LNEQELITELVAGNETAFRQLYAQYSDRVYNTCLGVLQHQEDAEDVTQEVFVEVFRSVKNFKGGSSLYTWIYKVALSKTYDHLKRKKAGKRFAFVQSLFGDDNELTTDKPHFDHPGVLAENKEHSRALFQALQKLPDKQQAAFTLHKLEGLPHKEVAEIMNTTVSSVESLLFRANENLKNYLSVYYDKNVKVGAGSFLSLLLM
jgi:RNA polymerase sigma-70 factor (ECF subfamily)